MSANTYENAANDNDDNVSKNSGNDDGDESPAVGNGGTDEDAVKEELRRTLQEMEEYKDRYLRSIAEMDNLRKRTAKERSDLLKFGAEALLTELLPVVDSFDKACSDQENDAAKGFREGMFLVKKQLNDVLQRHGLQAIEAVGKPFDPNLHQAIQRIDADDVDEEIVHEEFAKGYLLHDRLLRPSMVSVKVPTKK